MRAPNSIHEIRLVSRAAMGIHNTLWFKVCKDELVPLRPGLSANLTLGLLMFAPHAFTKSNAVPPETMQNSQGSKTNAWGDVDKPAEPAEL